MKVTWKTWWLPAGLLIAVILSLGVYLGLSLRTYALGFPLDDAWIHQSYARNLVQRGEWAFLPGRLSAGSTSPLWAGMLALGYLLGIDPRLWTYVLGGASLLATAWLCGRWIARRLGRDGSWLWMVCILFVFEWHMAWAAVSGMEILPFGLLSLAVLSELEKRAASPLFIGALIGLAIWLRPEGLLLGLAALWVIIATGRKQAGKMLLRIALLVTGLALLLVPYLVFNYLLAGEWWPTTFYAKQAEYAITRGLPLLRRLVDQFGVPLIGVLAILLPGIALGFVRDVRSRNWHKLAPLVWACAHLGAYAVRLPLIYQHGRYAMPVVPVLYVLGIEGVSGWLDPNVEVWAKRILSRAWLLSIPVVAACFWYLGARSYAQDVAIIESEMVAASRWIAGNTDPGALVAAHDIGALGYFGDREVLDLAGLVDPQVIPIIRDEEALARMLDSRRADYLMTFPEWYPQLIQRGERVYTTEGRFSPAAGMENMAVYDLR